MVSVLAATRNKLLLLDIMFPYSSSSVCNSTCINGTCDLLSGVCECNDGYVGIDCSTGNLMPTIANAAAVHSSITSPVCPPDTYGAGCQQNCSCTHESSPCNAVDGTCNCLPGYTGVACEIGNPSSIIQTSFCRIKEINYTI